MSYPYNSLHFLTLRIHFAFIHSRTVKRGWSFWQKKLLVAVKWWRHWTLFSRLKVDRVSTLNGTDFHRSDVKSWRVCVRRPAEASPRSNRTTADTKTHCDILQCLISTLCNNPTVAAVASNRCSNNNQKMFSSKSTPADIPRCLMSSIASQDDLMVNKCLGSSFDLEDHLGQRSFVFLCRGVRFIIHASRHGKIVSKKQHERGVLHSQGNNFQSKDVFQWMRERNDVFHEFFSCLATKTSPEYSMIFHIFHILVAQFWFIFCSALYIHPTLISSMRDWGSNSLAICQVGSRLSNQPGRDWTSVCQRLKFNGLRVVLAALREPTNGSIRKNPVVVTVHFDVLHMEVQIVYPWVPTNWWQDQTCLWQRCDMILLARRLKGDLKRFYHTV